MKTRRIATLAVLVSCYGGMMTAVLYLGPVGWVPEGLIKLLFLLTGILPPLATAFIVRRLVCPDCSKVAPRFRLPENRRQELWGGWTCPACGCEVDSAGDKVSPPAQEDARE
jgi:hypothetical protein